MISKRMQEIGLTPAKAVLIAVLVIILISVVVSQLVVDATETSIASRKSKRGARVTEVVNAVSGESTIQLERDEKLTRQWPEIQLVDAIAHDPFALPRRLRPTKIEAASREAQPQKNRAAEDEAELARVQAAAAEQRRKRLEAIKNMQESGTGIVLVTPEAQVMIIGNKKLKVGDLWDGFRIVEIRPNGKVVLAIE